ncbi:hypothetical protein [Romboutsia ilealis]|uniref:hypothetical protein n=1 Tax=Romboutsia ilealis TaxID=1115758 RepID=UPI00272C7009|nr:hypothetical protein [Romboutsia ilealis]
MEKLENVAYLVMENTTEPAKPQNLQVIKENGLFYIKFETVLQSFGVQNRNKRIYDGDAMMESLNAPHIRELIMNKTWKGEAGHPLSKDTARIVTIDPKLTSHKINSFYRSGNLLKGEIETLDDDALGRRMTKNILQGMEPAFSLRALAPLMKRADGTSLMKGKAHIVTYDWVILPSHMEAYRDKSKPIEKISQVIENAGNCSTDMLVNVNEASLTNFLKEESKNIKLVSNICEVATENMTLSEDMKYAILKEGSSTYHVKIEDKIKHDIRSFMCKF